MRRPLVRQLDSRRAAGEAAGLAAPAGLAGGGRCGAGAVAAGWRRAGNRPREHPLPSRSRLRARMHGALQRGVQHLQDPYHSPSNQSWYIYARDAPGVEVTSRSRVRVKPAAPGDTVLSTTWRGSPYVAFRLGGDRSGGSAMTMDRWDPFRDMMTSAKRWTAGSSKASAALASCCRTCGRSHADRRRSSATMSFELRAVAARRQARRRRGHRAG